MTKTIEKKITLTKMNKPINESRLKPNEYKISEYWKASYIGLEPKQYLRGEMTAYQRIIDIFISTRQNDFPKEITFKCY